MLRLRPAYGRGDRKLASSGEESGRSFRRAPPDAAPVVVAAAGDSVWLYSDPSFVHFGLQVPDDLIPGAVTEDKVGLTTGTLADGTALWTSMQKVAPADRDAWLSAKRTGAGRDRRLLPIAELPAPASLADRPLYRVALDAGSSAAEPDRAVFEGPSTHAELSAAISASGGEPPAFLNQWLQTSGVNASGQLAREFSGIVLALWYGQCFDLVDIRTTVMGEHLSRRALQIMRAVRRCPKAPDFSGLEIHTRHWPDSTGAVRAPAWDKFVMENQKVAGQYLKQSRLQREEEESAEKKKKQTPKGEKGAGKGDGQ